MSILPMPALTKLTLIKPSLGGTLVSVDSGTLPIVVDADIRTAEIQVTIEAVITTSSEWVLYGGKRRFSISPTILPTSTPIKVMIVGLGIDPVQTPTLTFSYIYTQSSSLPAINPPGGVKIYRGATNCKVEWARPEDMVMDAYGDTSPTGFLGVRVMISTDPTGISIPYVQLGSLETSVSRSENNVISSTSASIVDPANSSRQTITTVQTTVPINFSERVIDKATVSNANKFYVILSTVIQDPSSNHIYESNFNGPFTCGFVDLRQVSPTDFLTVQQKEEVALRLITSTTQNYPDLDLSPRSELRDVLIDPVALEISEQSVREWFARVSSSITAIATLDDYDGDGFSDPLVTNPYKPIIANAWNLGETDIQTLIDKQFDILGERAGLVRGGATTSTVMVTIYTYSKPTSRLSIDAATTQASSVADADTASLTFYCRGSITIDPASADALYDPIKGWWSVTLPFECSVAGSIGNVGVAAIRQPVSGTPSGWLCTNLTPALFGSDGELNAKYAERIKDRLVVGVDSGRRLGYLNIARAIPGVIAANVVSSGDLEMLRDWDDVRKKHTYGTVDVYVRGTSSSQQVDTVPFVYETMADTNDPGTYQIADYTSKAFDASNKKDPKLQFKVRDFSKWVYPIAAIFDMLAVGTSTTIHLGTRRVKIDTTNGMISLDPNEYVYTIKNADTVNEYKEVYTVNGVAMNNQTFLFSLGSSTVTYTVAARVASPLAVIPPNQPVTAVTTVSGAADMTGVIPPNLLRLIKTDDPLLEGFSSRSNDQIRVDSSTLVSPVQTKTLQFVGVELSVGSLKFTAKKITRSSGSWITDGLQINDTFSISGLGPILPTTNTNNGTYTVASVTDTAITILEALISDSSDKIGKVLLIPVVPIDTGMVLSATGGVWSVRNSDSSIVYSYGTPTTGNDYTIVALGRYGSYGIRMLSSARTAAKISAGTAIELGSDILVSYDKYRLTESCNFITETLVISGSAPTKLSKAGFVKNVWLPESHSLTTLSMDGWNLDPVYYTPNSLCSEGIKKPYRYIKVTYMSPATLTALVMKENQDYTLSVDSMSGEASITRIMTGRIPQDSTNVDVSYFYTEAFDVTTLYPGYINQVVDSIELMRHAAGDVLVKDMVGNAVDVDMTVEISPNVSADVMDARIRTTIGVILDNAQGRLTQSELIRQVKSLNGVTNVQIPLTKFSKANGAYNVGTVIPTGTPWTKTSLDPLFAGKTVGMPINSWITASSVLIDNTLPSGGLKDSFVGFVYEGEEYTRTFSIGEFGNSGPGCFYIIGADDSFMNGELQVYTGIDAVGRVLISLKTDIVTKANYTPAQSSFRATYQVWEDGGTRDIVLSPTEYLKSGRITINYILNQ